jgi:hypothetical protein
MLRSTFLSINREAEVDLVEETPSEVEEEARIIKEEWVKVKAMITEVWSYCHVCASYNTYFRDMVFVYVQ